MLAEKNNVLTLIVERGATKRQIKEAVEKLYGVKVEKVNALITPLGEKKAYVKLAEGYSAMDVLTRLGVL
jgi:large subunit ribosomal protein L23